MFETADWRYLSGFIINVIIFITLTIKGRVKVTAVIPLALMVVFSWVGTIFFVLGWLVNKYPYLRYFFTGDMEDYKAWKKSQVRKKYVIRRIINENNRSSSKTTQRD